MTRDSSLANTNKEEQVVYDHLMESVRTYSPDTVLERMRSLFVRGKDYNDTQISMALARIVNSKQADRQFGFFFNRCCHILINYWQLQVGPAQDAIPELVSLFERLPQAVGASTTSGRLRKLVIDFTKTDHYLKMQRLARIISEKNKETPLVGNLINRYPYLYDHYLLTDNSNKEQQQTVRQIQTQIQRRFEIDLSQYVTYKVRSNSSSRNSRILTPDTRIITPGTTILRAATNPTLLTDKEISTALKQFIGKSDNGYSYREIARCFQSHSAQIPTYKKYKKDLYEYIVHSIDTTYGSHQFNKKLYQKMESMLPHCDEQKPDEFLIIRTSSQILNFLVVESAQQPEHYLFVDMITNLGASHTVGILLKMVLLCRKVKPYLEKRFTILFGHYEGFDTDGVPWLIRSLENLHIAFSIHFGKADLSCLKQIM